MTDRFKTLIEAAVAGPLERSEAIAAFEIMMSGEATPGQIGGFLMALRTRGETVGEIAAATTVMRDRCLPVRAPSTAIDIVGTGGDGKHTLNISTAAALVVAGAGVPVAKHGNRALSSRAGAADTLSALGVGIMSTPETVERSLDEAGIGFMMAPVHHVAMRHVGPVRQELGTRTIFNVLGPLTNPAGVERQLTGVYDRALCRPLAEALGSLGSRCAWVVHGDDGSDEMSISGPTQVAVLANGVVSEREVLPREAGLDLHPPEVIAGGEPETNARRIRELLAGEKSGFRDAVLLNAAAALVVAGVATTLAEGAAVAAQSIDSGEAAAVLDHLVHVTAAAPE